MKKSKNNAVKNGCCNFCIFFPLMRKFHDRFFPDYRVVISYLKMSSSLVALLFCVSQPPSLSWSHDLSV